MRYFSTFSGIGGFEIGTENAHRTVGRRQGEAIRELESLVSDPAIEQPEQIPVCVGYSEIDKYASSVYEYHNPGVKNYGDITKINAEELPDFDCIVGGFPCQAFSIAGKRRGFDDTRGTLFFDLARILRAKQPRLFVFENVKGLLSHDNGNTFKTIIATSDELGYDCQWQVLNSKNHGVAQNRERVFIIGHLRGTCRPKVLPYSSDNGEATNPATHKGAIVDLTLRADKGYRVRRDLRAGTIDANYYKGIANQERPGVIVGTYISESKLDAQIRRLTPIECERLQGFPDNFTAQGINGAISDTQRYKMCGNAVTVNVVQAVFERILKEGA